jgi:hypothetical protein
MLKPHIRRALRAKAQHRQVKARIGDQQIGPLPHDQKPDATLAEQRCGGGQHAGIRTVDQQRAGSAEAEGGVVAEPGVPPDRCRAGKFL